MKKLILASKSPYRKQLLSRLGIEFECVDSNFDEDSIKNVENDPVQLTQKLAKAKAKALNLTEEGTVIIGSDQVCSFDDKILGKTGSIEGSFEQLKMLQGATHRLITSYCLYSEGIEIIKTNITSLKMRNLNDLQIKKYLSIDNPVDCAGSYKLELNGISLMEKISTDDYTAIIGLPLIMLSNDLNSLGIEVPPAC